MIKLEMSVRIISFNGIAVSSSPLIFHCLLSLSVCLCMSVSVCLCAYLIVALYCSLYLWVCLCVFQSVGLYHCLHVFPFVLSTDKPINRTSVGLSVNLCSSSTRLSVASCHGDDGSSPFFVSVARNRICVGRQISLYLCLCRSVSLSPCLSVSLSLPVSIFPSLLSSSI